MPPSGHADGPIGVFDSGLGGLTVVAALRRQLPRESIVYLGDTARVPYGTRSPDVVRRYAEGAARVLLARGAKALVIACNTASAHALPALRQHLPVPVIGVIDAGARAAAMAAPRGRLGVVATEGTVESGAYPAAIAALAPGAQLFLAACPLLVPLAEEGLLDHPASWLLLEEYVAPLVARRLDALVLGCTHYPLFLPLFRRAFGGQTQILDSASAAATAVQQLLHERGLNARGSHEGTLSVLATDVTRRVERGAALFLGAAPPPVEWVDL